MKPTKPQLKVIKDIFKRQKGWPVGIAISKAMAKRLIDKSLAEWAPPIWGYQSLANGKYSSIRLTTVGTLYAEGRL